VDNNHEYQKIHIWKSKLHSCMNKMYSRFNCTSNAYLFAKNKSTKWPHKLAALHRSFYTFFRISIFRSNLHEALCFFPNYDTPNQVEVQNTQFDTCHYADWSKSYIYCIVWRNKQVWSPICLDMPISYVYNLSLYQPSQCTTSSLTEDSTLRQRMI
jgi:hypothetical protein